MKQRKEQQIDEKILDNGAVYCSDRNFTCRLRHSIRQQCKKSAERLHFYHRIYINEDAQTVTDALGTPPSGTYEALSCAFEGKDTFYYYDGFTLQTYEKDGKKYIYTITLEDDTVNTAEGIKIGDSFAAVTKAYGTDYVAAGNTYAYSKDKMTLTFVMNNDKVSTISYSLLTSK